MAACTARLQSLRPGMDAATVVAVATDLWEELGTHDPEIAAEMEHEGRADEAVGTSPERTRR